MASYDKDEGNSCEESGDMATSSEMDLESPDVNDMQTSEMNTLGPDVLDTDPIVYNTTQECANEIRIVLIGRTGNGKSATGNSILNQIYFPSEYSPQSVTEKCRRGEIERGDKKVIVVDTPGLFDTKKVSDEIRKEIIKCIGVSSPGPHAIIYVLSLSNRLTEEEINTFVEMRTIFGDELFKYLIFLFTGKDELERRNVAFKDFLNRMPTFFQKVLKKCNKRSIAFNNRPGIKDEDKEQQVENLFSLIAEINRKTKGRYFCNQMIRDTERIIREELEKMFRKAEETGSPLANHALKAQLRGNIRDKILMEGEILKRLWRLLIFKECSIL